MRAHHRGRERLPVALATARVRARARPSGDTAAAAGNHRPPPLRPQRVTKRWAVAVLLLFAVAACGRSAPPRAAPVGPPHWTTATCPHPPAHAVVIGEPPGRHAIPAGFHPTWVLRCLIAGSAVVAQRADLTPAEAAALVRALAQPSATPSVCPEDSAAHTVVVPYFALIDARGRALLTGLPADRCGRPESKVDRILSALTYALLWTSPIR
jgi:predicted small lipoprotein YifL